MVIKPMLPMLPFKTQVEAPVEAVSHHQLVWPSLLLAPK